MTRNGWRGLRLALWAAVAALGLAALWPTVIAPRLEETAADRLGRGDYRLETTEGTPFTAAALKGAPSAVFFGYTHCPDVCPTTLGDIAGWKEALGEDGARLRAFFVTVDPERDTLEVLKDYLSWAPGVTGVSGSAEATKAALADFRIYARKVEPEAGGDSYLMDHTAYVMLFDRNGRFDQIISYQENTDTAVAKLKALVGS